MVIGRIGVVPIPELVCTCISVFRIRLAISGALSDATRSVHLLMFEVNLLEVPPRVVI